MNEGKKDRRDPIRTIKARNPVAKNASAAIGSGAAGAHKDKKKAAKQGEVKHKKAEYAESLQVKLDSILAEGPNDGKEDNFTIDDIKRLEKIRDLETLKAQAKELIKGKPARRMKPEKISWFYNHIDTLKNPLAIIKMMYDLMLAGEGHKVIGSRNSMSSNTYRSRFGEEYDAEYDDEAGMARSNLLTLARAVKGLFDTIEKNDNLPEWAQEKIAKAEMMLVSVWDYMLSQKEQGIDPEINELNKSTLGSYVKKAGQDVVDRSSASSYRSGASGDKYNKADSSQKEISREKGIDRALSKLTKEGLQDPNDNPCWKGYKPVGTKKKGSKTVPNCVPKEGWTHDSLAAQLFETENTYEDRLSNLLNKRLGK